MTELLGRCSVASMGVGEPVIGSAPRARAWLVLEQNGPYGFAATTDSHLPVDVREALALLPKNSGTTVALARRPGPHPDDGSTRRDRRRFWLAYVAPGHVLMRSGELPDSELTRPDLADVLARAAQGSLPEWGEVTTTPLFLVCTNGRRDVCCAIEGRPLAAALATDPRVNVEVLEASHLGGHRFAPTALLLPWGHAFGRLDREAAVELLTAQENGSLAALATHRGRTSLAQAAQVAEHAVRLADNISGIDDLDVLGVDTDDATAAPIGLRWPDSAVSAQAEVRHRDGRAWRVALHREALGTPRNESCGKAELAAEVWVADPPRAIPAH